MVVEYGKTAKKIEIKKMKKKKIKIKRKENENMKSELLRRTSSFEPGLAPKLCLICNCI